MQAYKVVFQLPELTILFPAKLIILGTIFAVASTTIATYLSCRKEMAAKPSDLMRAKAPKSGRRVLLEKVPFIWKRMNFSAKVTTRNLFRKKSRFVMTIAGIGGCTALILGTIGLYSSVNNIMKMQYDENGIAQYDVQIVFDQNQTEETSIMKALKADNRITDIMLASVQSVTGSSERTEKTNSKSRLS